jgi:hypothetical protein
MRSVATRRLSTAQIFVSLVFDLSYLYAIVGRFPHARSVPLLQTKIFGFDALAPQSVRTSAGNITAYQETRETEGYP